MSKESKPGLFEPYYPTVLKLAKPFDTEEEIDNIAKEVTNRIITFMPGAIAVDVKDDSRIGHAPGGKNKSYDQGKLDALQFKKLQEEFLFERTGDIKYGCLMVNFKCNEHDKVAKQIKKEDLYDKEGFGIEHDCHVTILYGFHKEVDSKELFDKIRKDVKDGIEIKLTDISCFEGSDNDVLKFGVESDLLHRLNKKVREFPHTNKFSDYKPHMTIAYVKKGKGREYVKKLKLEKPVKLYSKDIVYSFQGKNETHLTF